MLLLLLLLARATIGAYVTLTFYTGEYTTVVVYNDSITPTDFVLTAYNATSRTLFVAGLASDGAVSQVLCQPSFITRILIAPKGCDNPDPALAVENSNCATSTVEAQELYLSLQQSWSLPSLSTGDLRFG